MENNDETFRIDFPYSRNKQHPEFSVIVKRDSSHIKSLIIQQDKYDRYVYSRDTLVTIPKTISRLGAVEAENVN